MLNKIKVKNHKFFIVLLILFLFVVVIADNHRVRSFHGRKEEQSRQQRVKSKYHSEMAWLKEMLIGNLRWPPLQDMF